MSNIYKVIIIDDEVDTFCNTDKIEKCLTERIDLIKAHNIKELESHLNNFGGYVDAIITDVNFNAGDDAVGVDDDDSSGFDMVQQIVTRYRAKGIYIPYYVCSGKPDLVRSRYLKYRQLKELEFNGRIFNKEDFWGLIDKIKTDIEHIQSPAFRLANQYELELKAAKNGISPQTERLLLNILVYCDSGEYDYSNTIGHFTSLRKIAEKIQDKCLAMRIIPPKITSLNDLSRFMSGMTVAGYKIQENETIMPPVLARSLWFYLDITQDASHERESLTYYVGKYVKEQGNSTLLRTMTNIALEICLWFNRYFLENLDLKANEDKWIHLEEDKQRNEIYRGVVETAYSFPDNKRISICGQYAIPKRDEGEEVVIYGPIQKSNFSNCYCNSEIRPVLGFTKNVESVKE